MRTNLSRFAASGITPNQNDRVVVNCVHDLCLHVVYGQRRPRSVALHQSLFDLTALRPAIFEVLEQFIYNKSTIIILWVLLPETACGLFLSLFTGIARFDSFLNK